MTHNQLKHLKHYALLIPIIIGLKISAVGGELISSNSEDNSYYSWALTILGHAIGSAGICITTVTALKFTFFAMVGNQNVAAPVRRHTYNRDTNNNTIEEENPNVAAAAA